MFRTFSSGGSGGGGASGGGGGGGGGGGSKGGSGGGGGLWAAYLALLQKHPVGGCSARCTAAPAWARPRSGGCASTPQPKALISERSAQHAGGGRCPELAPAPAPGSPCCLLPMPPPAHARRSLQRGTKAVTAGILNGLGDAIAQLVFEKGADFDWRRCAIFSFLVSRHESS